MGKLYLQQGKVASGEGAASCDRGLTRRGPLYTSRLPGIIQSIVCFVVHLSKSTAESLDHFGDGCTCNPGVSSETPRISHGFPVFHLS